MSLCRHSSCVLSVLCVLSVVFVYLMRLMVACLYVLVVSSGMKGCVEFSGSSHSAVLFPAWRSRRHLNDSCQAEHFSGLVVSPTSDWGIGDAEPAQS